MNEDMPGLDTDMVVHHFPLRPECKPVKQKFRRMKMAVQLKIKEEVQTETTQCRISNGSRVSRMGSKYSASPEERWESQNVC